MSRPQIRNDRKARKFRPVHRFRPQIAALEARTLLNADVLTSRNDQFRTGTQPNETQLTPQNVNPTSFGLLDRVAVDGYVYAQPLYASNVTMPDGSVHNVVYVATEHDSVYAIDSDTGAQLWKTNYLDPNNPVRQVTTVPGGAGGVLLTSDIVPEVGISGAPVIDRNTNEMFFITKTQETVPDPTGTTTPVVHYVQRLHAVDISTGQDVITPVTLGDTVVGGPNGYINTTNIAVPGNTQGSVGGIIQFNALRENDRAAMALVNGVVYATYASHGDNGPYEGWVIGYNEATLQLVNMWNASPYAVPNQPGGNGQSGIWMSGSAPSVDDNGNLVLSTGNGTFGAFAVPQAGATALGQTGGGLGYAGITNSLAIKFDAYKPSGNHSSTGLYVNGDYPNNSPLLPGDVFNDLAGTGIDFNASAQSGAPDTYQAHLVYDGTTLTETLTDTTTGATVSFPYTVNITQLTGSNTAYVGFGGGTGGLNSFQDLTSWTYTSAGGQTVIDHSAGFASHADLTNNGSATYSGAVAQLTTGQNSQGGTIFATNPVDVTHFDTTFTFQMLPGSNPIADGLTFIIQNAPGRPFLPSYGESVVKLTPATYSPITGPGISTVPDFFTPYEYATLNANDTDLGSGASMVLPDQPGTHPHLAVETGKSGKVYLIDLDNMGKVNPNGTGPDFVYQTVQLGPVGVWGSPAFYTAQMPDGTTQSFIYYHGSGDKTKMIRLVQVPDPANPGQVETRLETDPTTGQAVFYSISNDTFNFPGGQPSISSNNGLNGIDWEVQDDQYGQQLPAVLHAYDALDLTKEIYRSDQFTSSNLGPGYGGTNNRDQMGGAVKFVIPTIADGHVFVGTEDELDIFGLFAANTTLPTAPSGLTATAQRGNQIQLQWNNDASNATAIQVLRSTDGVNFTPVATVGAGSDPTTQTTYTDHVPNASTLYYYELVAVNQLGQSAPSDTVQVASLAPVPIVTVADVGPAFIRLTWTNAATSPLSTYTVERSQDNGATYTTLITGLSATTTTYTDPTAVQGPVYLYRVTSVNPTDQGVSDPVQAQIGPVTVDHSAAAGGFSQHNDLQANGSAIFSVPEQLARLTNNYNQAGSVFTTQKVGDRAFHTEFTFRLHEGTQDTGIADGLTFVIQSDPRGPSALGPNGGQLGYTGITHSIAVKFDVFQNSPEPSPSTTGVFLNGASPQGAGPGPGIGTSNDTLQYGINLRDQHTKDVVLDYDGTTLTETLTDLLTGATHTFTYAVNIPGAVGDAGYAGFTGAGGASDYTLEDILNWSYNEEDGSLPAPRAPSNLIITNATDTTVTLRWDSNNAYTATGYSIERSTSPEFTTDVTEVGRISPTTDTFTDTGVAPGTYYYRVRSFAGNPPVYSTYSNVTNGITVPLPSTIDHSAGFASHSDLTANGNASFVGTAAQLTPATGSQAGSIFFTSPLNVTHFTTDFTFVMQAGSNPIADGLTFTIQGVGPQALGAGGGGLGYQGIANSVAIKFDSYKPSGNHSSTGLYVNGDAPNVPPNLSPGDVYNDLAGTGIDFNAAAHATPPDPFHVTLGYDGTTLTETITDTVTGATATFTYTVNIQALLGGSQIGYVGFTGGTGGANSTQQILTWTFSNGTMGGPAALASNGSSVVATDSVQAPSSNLGTTGVLIPLPASAANAPSSSASPPPTAQAKAPALTDNGGNSASLRVRQTVKRVESYLDELATTL